MICSFLFYFRAKYNKLKFGSDGNQTDIPQEKKEEG